MHLDSFGRSSKEYTTDNYNKVSKNINELFRKCNNEIDEVKTNHEEKILNTQNKINEIEEKFIKEMNGIKNRIISLEKDMNNHIKYYFDLKDEINKLSENIVTKEIKKNKKIKNKDIHNIINKTKVNILF